MLYVTGNYSLGKLKEEITAMGARAKNGKPFAVSQINKILKNPFYCDVMESKYGVFEHQ